MKVTAHEMQCAKRHNEKQVPNATLRKMPIGPLSQPMANDFRSALKWHMAEHNTTIAQLVKATGISRDVINKLLTRENSSTVAENALLVSAYYGKTLEQFINCDDGATAEKLGQLAGLLTPDEARILEAQVLGILQQRGALPTR
jgi:plasmid maintenance system antidote protein VapI